MPPVSNRLTLIAFLILLGCGAQHEKESYATLEATDMAMANKQESGERVSEDIEVSERKLIKEGNIAFETNHLASTRKTISQAVRKYNGYISSDQEYKSPGRKSNTLVIRVPSQHFDSLLNDATLGVEKFENKEISVNDVTEEFLDIQARVKTKKELESRYLDLLKQAKKVSEILEIEKQIGELRSEIESIEGRLKYLQNKVSYSTLTMTFYESIPDETAFGQKFTDGFRNGWTGLIWFFVALTTIWPFILIGLGLLFGLRFFRQKK